MRYRRTVSFPPLTIRPKPWRLTKAGSGIYVPNTDDFPAHFRGMGIRIEDSVCVQEENPLVLTTEAVKEVRLISQPWGQSLLNK